MSYNQNNRFIQLVDRELLFFRRYGNPIWPWMPGGDDELVASEVLDAIVPDSIQPE
jgi:hypothetical protein